MAKHDENSDAGKGLPQPRAKTAQAQRALDEAAQRRRNQTAGQALPREVNGREGLDPVRYGDWENKGIASDF